MEDVVNILRRDFGLHNNAGTGGVVGGAAGGPSVSLLSTGGGASLAAIAAMAAASSSKGAAAPMLPGGSAVPKAGSPGKPAPPPPIYVADKLFDEFSLGRINARPASSSSSGPLPSQNARIVPNDMTAGGFQPSAPPFECIGRSNVEVCGFDDIFGGVPGIKSRTAIGNDDVFPMGAGAGSSSGRSHQRSSSCSSSYSSLPQQHFPSSSSYETIGSARPSKSSDRLDANAATSQQSQQPPSATRQPLNTSTVNAASGASSSPSNGFLAKAARGNSVGGPGSSRFGSSCTGGPSDAETLRPHEKDAVSYDRPNQNGSPQSSAPPYVKAPLRPQEKNSVLCDEQNPTAPAKVASPLEGSLDKLRSPKSKEESAAKDTVQLNKLEGSLDKLRSPKSKEESAVKDTVQLNKLSDESSSSPRQFSEMGALNHAADKYRSSIVEDVLLPKENGSWQTETPAVSSFPQKTKRPSATERLKAVLFPDFTKKEDKAHKMKGWFTVGDVKLVTQPTDVPPPARAPPQMDPLEESNVFKKVSRDERWRRRSCEFPSGRDAAPLPKEAAGHPQVNCQPCPADHGEDLLSSSATAMKEAVERAEAKQKQKQRIGETATGEGVDGKTSCKVDMKELRKQQGGEQESEMDKRAVERAAHELREKALRKAAERAAAHAHMKSGKGEVTGVENLSRSSSAPKQRILDEAERISKKAFFSGEQCRPISSRQNVPPKNSDPSQILAAAKLEEEKKQRRESSERMLEERAAKVLAEKNQRELNAQQEQEERHRVSARVDARVRMWAAGKEGNLRALLVSLQDVLWPGSGWQPVSSSELSTEISIKKVYRKATLCVHPDKMQQKGATVEEKLIAEKVFDLLKGAWNKFNSHEAFFWQT